MMASPTISVSPQARRFYIAFSSLARGFATCSRHESGQFRRSDFGSQPFTGIYEPGQPTGGPLGGASIVGAPRITPKTLKAHLDQFVVGQERAKKVFSVAICNHYQRIQELQRRDEEQEELMAQRERRAMGHRHPVEDEFPGQQPTVNLYHPPDHDPHHDTHLPGLGNSPLVDNSPLTIEKSNVLLFGPSGVGKTYMAKTLARVLEVPFSMSDCTPLTQAGYIGEDVEVCVQRLLAAANYDVERAERGIICLDEIDKIATARVSHGKDVSGEGVQQALLKILEGTTVQIQAKPERGIGGGSSGRGQPNMPGGFPSHSPLGGGMNQGQPGGKGEVYNVRTDNILFICTGAFIGLHKVVGDRISKGSIGFGASVRASADTNSSHDTTLRGQDELFKKHLPFYISESDQPGQNYNILDLVEPSDLQKYGMIPELVGRIPISCALSSLDEEALVRVLTEPRNCLLRQFQEQFQLYSIELRFTSGALREVARTAAGMGTGARGLRTVLERLLGESMYETPGSPIKHILITEAVAQRKQAPIYMARGQQHQFNRLIAAEEEEWERRKQAEEQVRTDAASPPTASNFEEWRQGASSSGTA